MAPTLTLSNLSADEVRRMLQALAQILIDKQIISGQELIGYMTQAGFHFQSQAPASTPRPEPPSAAEPSLDEIPESSREKPPLLN